MSLSGDVRIRPRANAALVCSRLVAQTAQELNLCSTQALRYQVEEFRASIAQDLSETQRAYRLKLIQTGAAQVTTSSPALQRDFDARRSELIAESRRQGRSLPPALLTPPSIVTRQSVDALAHAREGLARDATFDLSETIQRSQTAATNANRAFEAACIAAASSEPTHREASLRWLGQTIFDQASAPGAEESFRVMLQAQQAQIGRDVEAARTALLTASAIEASRRAGLQPQAVPKGVHAFDPFDPNRRLEVRVDARAGKLSFELFNYRGGSCAPVQAKFTEALADLLGIDTGSVTLYGTTGNACDVGGLSGTAAAEEGLARTRERENA